MATAGPPAPAMAVSFNLPTPAEKQALVPPAHRPPLLPARVVTGAIVHTGLFVAFLMRVNVSVAIARMGFDVTQSGAVLGAFFLGYIWTQVPGGWAASQFGGARVFQAGVGLSSVLALLTVLTPGRLWLLITIRVLQGLCQGVVFPSATTLIAKWAPIPEQNRMMGSVMVGGLCGTVAGLAMSGPISAMSEWHGWQGWQWLFALHGTMGLLWTLVSFLTLYSSPATHPSISLEEYDYIKKGRNGPETPDRVPWSAILRAPCVWAVIMAHLSYNWIFYCFLTCLPKYMRDIMHFDLSSSGLTSCVPYMALSCVSFCTGYAADALINNKWSKTFIRRGCISGGLTSVGAILIGSTYLDDRRSLPILILGFAVLGLPASAIQIMFLDLSPTYSGLLQGVSNSLGTVVGAIAPTVTYHVAAHGYREEWREVFIISFGVMLAGAIPFALFGRHTPQPWDAPPLGPVLSDMALSFNSALLHTRGPSLVF